MAERPEDLNLPTAVLTTCIMIIRHLFYRVKQNGRAPRRPEPAHSCFNYIYYDNKAFILHLVKQNGRAPRRPEPAHSCYNYPDNKAFILK